MKDEIDDAILRITRDCNEANYFIIATQLEIEGVKVEGLESRIDRLEKDEEIEFSGYDLMGRYCFTIKR